MKSSTKSNTYLLFHQNVQLECQMSTVFYLPCLFLCLWRFCNLVQDHGSCCYLATYDIGKTPLKLINFIPMINKLKWSDVIYCAYIYVIAKHEILQQSSFFEVIINDTIKYKFPFCFSQESHLYKLQSLKTKFNGRQVAIL